VAAQISPLVMLRQLRQAVADNGPSVHLALPPIDVRVVCSEPVAVECDFGLIWAKHGSRLLAS